MRIVFTGGGNQTVQAVKLLSKKEHDIIVIEKDEKKIEQLRDQLDCSLLEGDGSNPEILQETNPQTVDFLFALTDSDPDNILTGLVGKSLGFKSVVVSVRNTLYEKVCVELGLENTIIPSRTIGNFLVDFIEFQDAPELKDYFKGEAHLFRFFIEEKSPKTVEKMALPSNSKVICFYREDKFHLISDDVNFQDQDEVIILTEKKEISNLEDKFLKTRE